jgi:hypothetical protein
MDTEIMRKDIENLTHNRSILPHFGGTAARTLFNRVPIPVLIPGWLPRRFSALVGRGGRRCWTGIRYFFLAAFAAPNYFLIFYFFGGNNRQPGGGILHAFRVKLGGNFGFQLLAWLRLSRCGGSENRKGRTKNQCRNHFFHLRPPMKNRTRCGCAGRRSQGWSNWKNRTLRTRKV